MLAVYMWAYIFTLAILWGFFLIARHHTYKFKNYSTNIVPMTNLLFIFLVALSIFGFFLIFSLDGETRTARVDTTQEVKQDYY